VNGMGDILNLFWIFLLISVFLPMIQKRILDSRRLQAIHNFERQRGS
jgi:hypothetical protein